MIGSKRKVITLYRELRKEGIDPGKFEHVYAPVGLDIGARTPEEIAIAIVAELIAVRRRVTAAMPHKRYVPGLAQVQRTNGNRQMR
jgi:xanthine dehydrogenase accessory factor